MQFASYASHRHAKAALEELGLFDFVVGLVDEPSVRVGAGMSTTIKERVGNKLLAAGWACPVRLDTSGGGPDLMAYEPVKKVVLQLQTGNIARGFYDLIKMQSLQMQGRASVGVLILPTNRAARALGSNLANFRRVGEELSEYYSHQITVPVLLVAFE